VRAAELDVGQKRLLVLRPDHQDEAVLHEAGVAADLGVEAGEEIPGLAGDLGDDRRGVVLPDDAAGPAAAPGCERLFLEQDDVGHPAARQVPGDARPLDAPPDDDDLRRPLHCAAPRGPS
jgi:hypothetical protein